MLKKSILCMLIPPCVDKALSVRIIKVLLIPLLLTSLFNTNANALSSLQQSACTVLLCLSASAGTRPHECSAPIRKFLKDTLNPRKWYKTVTNRKNFLKLCPTGTNPQIEQAVANSNQDDPNLDEYANAVATINPDECSADYLNNHVDIQILRGIRPVYEKQVPISQLSKYQNIKSIKPVLMNPACNSIYKSKYQELKEPTNTCNTQQSYTFQDWNNGYTKKQISHKEYLSLDDNQRAKYEQQVSYSYKDYIKYKKQKNKYQKQVKDGMITQRCVNNNSNDGTTCYYTFFYKIIPINKKCWID